MIFIFILIGKRGHDCDFVGPVEPVRTAASMAGIPRCFVLFEPQLFKGRKSLLVEGPEMRQTSKRRFHYSRLVTPHAVGWNYFVPGRSHVYCFRSRLPEFNQKPSFRTLALGVRHGVRQNAMQPFRTPADTPHPQNPSLSS